MVITHVDEKEKSFVVTTAREDFIERMEKEELVIGTQQRVKNVWKVWLNPLKLEQKSLLELVDYIASWDRMFLDYSDSGG